MGRGQCSIATMVDGLALGQYEVRPATPDDLEEMRLLLAWSERGHFRFQTARLAHLVADGLVRIVQRERRMAAFCYCTIDEPYSMVRGLALRPEEPALRVLEALLGWARPAGDAVRSLGLTYIGDDRWLLPALDRVGFKLSGQLVSLHRIGAYLPVPGNVAYRVRPAQASDLEALVRVDWSAFPLAWRNGPQTLREFLAQMRYFLVAEMDGEVRGYVCGTSQGRAGHVVRLAVHSDVQRQGVGTRLLREVLQRMSDTGVHGLSLNTQVENEVSQQFYARLGFTPLRRLTSVYRLDYEPR